MENILENLNDQQKKVVSLFNKNILVLAGAGSGKTRTIVYKIAWMIKNYNINPNSILVLTFTNKTMNEIKSRVNIILNNNLKMNWIGTFHSLSYQILKINYKEANLNSNFQIIDYNDQIKIINNILKNNNFLNKKNISSSNILKFINYYKENDYINENINNNFFLKINNIYKEICNSSSLIDFSELLKRSYDLFNKNSYILDFYKKKFKIILVDEFQDTNTIQYKWIKLLHHNNNFITAVGDDDQLIYGWRGAKIDNIKNFLNNFSNSILIYLERNYRSTNNIIQASNYLISNNINRYNKKLWTKKDYGSLIKIYKAEDEINEASIVINNIIKNIKINIFNKFAILYRKNSQSRVIEELLLLNKLKYHIYGGLRFLDRKEIKDVISYLRVILNRNDDLALERIINFPSRKIGSKSIEYIKDISKKNNVSYWNSILYILNNKLKESIKNKLINFINLINNIDKNIKNYPLPIQISKVIEYSGLWNLYENEDKNNNYLFSKLDNIIELINSSQRYCDIYSNNSLKEFISYLLIQYDCLSENFVDSNINLMTIHSSKGLEFNIVFIIGMEEGLFPYEDSIYNLQLLEEERRLAYVGFTRAIDKLILIYTKKRYIWGKYTYNKISRFINEIPIKYTNFIKN